MEEGCKIYRKDIASERSWDGFFSKRIKELMVRVYHKLYLTGVGSEYMLVLCI